MTGSNSASDESPRPTSGASGAAHPAARALQRPWYRRTWKRVAFTLIMAAVIGVAAGMLYLAASEGPSTATAGVTQRDLSGTGHAVTEYPAADRGKPVEVAGETLTGDTLATEDLRGAVVVVNVWGSWCTPCRAEAPMLGEATRNYSSEGVSFVGINVRDNEAAALAFEKRYRSPYPSIADFDGRTLLGLNVYVPASAVPVTLVLDRGGRIAARVLGEIRKATLTALLDTVLAETNPQSDGGTETGRGLRRSSSPNRQL